MGFGPGTGVFSFTSDTLGLDDSSLRGCAVHCRLSSGLSPLDVNSTSQATTAQNCQQPDFAKCPQLVGEEGQNRWRTTESRLLLNPGSLSYEFYDSDNSLNLSNPWFSHL